MNTTKICINCFELKNGCKCKEKEIGRLQKIDSNILYSITQLNKKGYKTAFCCGGHTERKFIYIYILFKDDYIFNALPKNYTYKDKNLSYKNIKIKNIELMQNCINEKIKDLENWINKL